MNTVYYAVRFLIVDLLWSLVYFIPWWYTKGRGNIEKQLYGQIQDMVRTLHLRTLGKFLFTPMYGLYDPLSRTISLAVRIVHFTILMTITFVYVIALAVFYILWLAFPVFVIYNIAFHAGLAPFNIYEGAL